jgi:hypothetical protein
MISQAGVRLETRVRDDKDDDDVDDDDDDDDVDVKAAAARMVLRQHDGTTLFVCSTEVLSPERPMSKLSFAAIDAQRLYAAASHLVCIISGDRQYLLERLCRCGGGGVEPGRLTRQEGHVGVRHR